MRRGRELGVEAKLGKREGNHHPNPQKRGKKKKENPSERGRRVRAFAIPFYHFLM